VEAAKDGDRLAVVGSEHLGDVLVGTARDHEVLLGLNKLGAVDLRRLRGIRGVGPGDG